MNMLCPLFHALICGFHVGDVGVSGVSHEVGYPVHGVLDRALRVSWSQLIARKVRKVSVPWNVAKHLVRSHYHEHVGEILDSKA